MDLLEYLSMCGKFNFSYGGISEWKEILDFVNPELLTISLDFVNHLYPMENSKLGARIYEFN